jgi:ABC-type sugar transport system ATPase subunit
MPRESSRGTRLSEHHSNDMQTAIDIRGISKSFPGVNALTDVSFSVRPGEVHAVVGENGAGKSTLMKILGGVFQADRGDILIHGKPARIRSVPESVAHGISVIYQEFNLMPELSVAENIFVADLPRHRFAPVLRLRRLRERTEELAARLEVDLAPGEYVKDLSVSRRQMVEIAKALHLDCSIIIMDEPTAALTSTEVEKLYQIIRTLKQQGKTILYISHRLKEIFDIADRVTVLRDGRWIATQEVSSLTQDDVVRMMVGRDVRQFYHHTGGAQGEVALEVRGLTKRGTFQDVSFSVRRGEILGIAGLMGSGREELVKALYGLAPVDTGEILVGGKPVRISSARDAIRLGIGFVTEDRKDAGIFPLMSVKENVSLNIIRSLSRFAGASIDVRRERALLDRFTGQLNLRYSTENQSAMFLSGGNQQKLVLARALAADCRILLLLEPTRGVDVGAKAEIYQLMGELTKAGIALVIVSSDLPELISVSSRVLVVWQGTVTGELAGEEITENAIMQCATGSRRPGGAA